MESAVNELDYKSEKVDIVSVHEKKGLSWSPDPEPYRPHLCTEDDTCFCRPQALPQGRLKKYFYLDLFTRTRVIVHSHS